MVNSTVPSPEPCVAEGVNPVAALQDFERPGAVTLYGECGGAFRGTVGIERKHIGGDFEIRHPLVVVIVHT